MLKEMDAAGVDRAVIVPPTWAGDSNEWGLDVAAMYPNRFAVVGRFDAKAPDARRQLVGWLKQPHMLGVRMSFHVRPFIDWLDDSSLDWFWAGGLGPVAHRTIGRNTCTKSAGVQDHARSTSLTNQSTTFARTAP
jgi:hypothetical protein